MSDLLQSLQQNSDYQNYVPAMKAAQAIVAAGKPTEEIMRAFVADSNAVGWPLGKSTSAIVELLTMLAQELPTELAAEVRQLNAALNAADGHPIDRIYLLDMRPFELAKRLNNLQQGGSIRLEGDPDDECWLRVYRPAKYSMLCVRVDCDGESVCTHFRVTHILDDSGKATDVLRAGIAAWLETPEGREVNDGICGDFNWGDYAEWCSRIPINGIVAVEVVEDAAVAVDHDERLAA